MQLLRILRRKWLSLHKFLIMTGLCGPFIFDKCEAVGVFGLSVLTEER